MQVATPSKIWPGDAAPNMKGIKLEFGGFAQIFVKLRDGAGLDSVWCQIENSAPDGLVGRIVDGPGELRGKRISFGRGNIFDVV